MACQYTYKGKTYEAWEFEDVLKAMSPSDAYAFMPSVKSIPSAPFVTKTEGWLNLALKRVMVMAAEGGYDKVAFVNGEQSAERYDLSKSISSVQYLDNRSGGAGDANLSGPIGSGMLIARDHNDKKVIEQRISDVSEIEDYVGKEVASRLFEQKPRGVRNSGIGFRQHDLSGVDLKVGGEGMKKFYDQIVPQAVKKLLPKVGGGQMESVNIPQGRQSAMTGEWSEGELSQPAFTITDAMRDKVAEGLPLFSRRRSANEDDKGYTGAYETDLFGQALPEDARARSGAGLDAATSGNLQPAAALRDTPAPQGEYFARTLVGSEVQRKLGTDRILTPEQAAQATAYLYRSAVERLDGIITDIDGKPLAAVGGFKGALSQASVYPATIMGEAVRVPGAARIWFSHNHPSGTATLSRADENLNGTLTDVFLGSGIEPMGLLAVTGKRFAHVDPSGNVTSGDMLAPTASMMVPAIERELADSDFQPMLIDSPTEAKMAAKTFEAKGGDGLMLLNAKNEVVGWLPISDLMRGRLRNTGGLNAIYRALSESNAGAAILVHRGSLDVNGGFGGSVTVGNNIAAALVKADVRPLDSINVATGASLAEQGGLIAAGPLFSIRRQTETPEFKRWSKGLPVYESLEDSGNSRGVYKVYHATTSDFNEFVPGGLNPKDSGVAIWLSPSATYQAALFRVGGEGRYKPGANVMPLYARLERPMVIDDLGMLEWARAAFNAGSEFPQIITPEVKKSITEEYDSIIFDGDALGWSKGLPDGGTSQEIIVFDPTQIKSAIGNDGSFDLANPDIRKSERRQAKDQTETPQFKRWFGDSKVVDENGNPRVMYHGTDKDFSIFSADKGRENRKTFFVTQYPEVASRFAGAEYTIEVLGGSPNVMAVYVRADKPFDYENASHIAEIEQYEKDNRYTDKSISGDVVQVKLGTWYAIETPQFQDAIKSLGFDGFYVKEGTAKNLGVFNSTQIKSAIGNNGSFDSANPDIAKSIRAGNSAWDEPEGSRFDDLVYKLQDKLIDTKRVIESITKTVGRVADDLNVYLQEELFHGRTAKATEDFGSQELKPLLQQMKAEGLTIADVEEYLHARHAQEANALIASREPTMPDGGSGMTNADAATYLQNLSVDQSQKLAAIAQQVDTMVAKTRQMYADYGLESQDTVNGWGQMFQHYVPLQREDKDGAMGIGQGFSIKGKEVKGRTGSTRKVVDILANIAMQRERLIVRGEKNRVAEALLGLASANPNPDFWAVGPPPTTRVYDPKTNSVVDRPDPMYKSRPNVLVAKVKRLNGDVDEVAVVFKEDNDRALRMASALKNLDAGNLEGLLGVSAKITRYFAAVNTQYNPVFGVVNLLRDVQGAMVSLGSTPLNGKQGRIARDTMSALRGIYGDIRAERKGAQGSSPWSALWDEFQAEGGQTGYRDLFKTSADRAEQLQSILTPDGWMASKLGRIFTAGGALKVPMSQAKKGADWIFGWLSDYNEAMENGVRLAAYKAGLDQGMSKQQAASLAKNLTVNFNRKGQIGQQAGAVYAFFNAAMQGSARLGQTLFEMEKGDLKTLRLSKTGKTVVYGGMLLGVTQALLLAAAGFDDEDPPEFVRERSLVIPTGGKRYITIPMPLGLHVIPGLGRHATEFALSGFKRPAKRAISVAGMFLDAFNPIGNAGMSIQTLAPTAIDPLVALTENRDWTGKPIARVSSNKAIPGFTQFKDTATAPGKLIAEAINWMSGGNQYVAGVISPTPDQIDYLLGQVTGGVGRELSKVEQTGKSMFNGEDLPSFKVPLLGRFYGNAAQQASQGGAFYNNLNELNALETEVKLMRKDGKNQEAGDLLRSRPDAYLIAQANVAERQVQKLRREKRELIAKDASRDQVRAKEEQITRVMSRLNGAVEQLKERVN